MDELNKLKERLKEIKNKKFELIEEEKYIYMQIKELEDGVKLGNIVEGRVGEYGQIVGLGEFGNWSWKKLKKDGSLSKNSTGLWNIRGKVADSLEDYQERLNCRE